jgi:hypothetical protein
LQMSDLSQMTQENIPDSDYDILPFRPMTIDRD